MRSEPGPRVGYRGGPAIELGVRPLPRLDSAGPTGPGASAAARAARSQAGDRRALSTRARRRHGQVDPFAPPVPPRELREHVPPARRKISHFCQNGARRKICILPKSAFVPTRRSTGLKLAKWWRCRTLSAGPHCCFLVGIRKPSCFTSCSIGPAGALATSWLYGAGWLSSVERAENAPEVRRTSLVHLGAGQIVGHPAAGLRNVWRLSFRKAPRLGRQARGKRACATIAPRHDDASPQKWGYGADS